MLLLQEFNFCFHVFGIISRGFFRLPILQKILYHKHLSGLAPSKEQFAAFDERSYIGNPELHWTLVNDTGTEAPPTPSSVKYEDDDTAIEMVSFCWSF